MYTHNHAGTYLGPKGEEEVAIKIPKTIWNTGRSPLEVEDLKAFYAEAQLALEFSHENVLSCLGISSGALVKKFSFNQHPLLIVRFELLGMNTT